MFAPLTATAFPSSTTAVCIGSGRFVVRILLLCRSWVSFCTLALCSYSHLHLAISFAV